jgi:hypothetical protein
VDIDAAEAHSIEVIRLINQELKVSGWPAGIAEVVVDEQGLFYLDPSLSVDVVVSYANGLRRWFHVMTFQAVSAYFAPPSVPTPVVYGLPTIIVEKITMQAIKDCIQKYLSREEGLAEQCTYPDGTISGGINLETQRLYHIRVSSPTVD